MFIQEYVVVSTNNKELWRQSVRWGYSVVEWGWGGGVVEWGVEWGVEWSEGE